MAQGLPRDVQGAWSGGGQGSDSRPAGSLGGKARQHWGREGLTHDRKSSSQEAGGPASQLVLGLRAALLTCTHGDSSGRRPGRVPASSRQQYSSITRTCTAAPTKLPAAHPVDKRVIIAACHAADGVNVRAVAGHIDVLHHKVQRGPNPQLVVQVVKVALQVRVPREGNPLVQAPAATVDQLQLLAGMPALHLAT